MEKEKLNWKRLLITIGIVLLTAAVVGGTVWFYKEKELKELEQSISLSQIASSMSQYCKMAQTPTDEQLEEFSNLPGISQAKVETLNGQRQLTIGYAGRGSDWATVGYSLNCQEEKEAEVTEAVIGNPISRNLASCKSIAYGVAFNCPKGWTAKEEISGDNGTITLTNGKYTINIWANDPGSDAGMAYYSVNYKATVAGQKVVLGSRAVSVSSELKGTSTNGYSLTTDVFKFGKNNYHAWLYADSNAKLISIEPTFKAMIESIR